MKMSDYIDETSLPDEEVAAAIAEAKAKKAARAKKTQEAEASKAKPTLEKTKSLDDESSDDLLNESSAAAQIEDEEDESPAVRSAKSFSNAFAAAKKKREQDLLRKKAERQVEPEEEPEEEIEEDESAEADEALAGTAVVAAASDDDDNAEFETDSEEEETFEDDDDDEYDEVDDDEDDDDEYDNDDDEYDEDDDEDGDFDSDGIFETDDENGEYNTTVNVDEDDEEDDEEDEDDEEEEEEEEEDDSTFSTKTKVIIGIVIAVLVIAIIAAIAFFMRNSGDGKDTSSIVSVAEGDVTSVKFAEPSVSIEVGETVALKLIVEPENATDKTFKLKSNDEAIVKVNEQGQITGIASGSTTVTATLKSNPTMTASLVVNVIDEEQSTLNIYNKFINSILDGSTDIDSDSDTESELDEENPDEEAPDSDSASDSDTDSEQQKPKAKRVLSGNKIEDLDSDGSLELALYYEPSTDNEEPLVRIFRLADANEEEDTDSEEELEYDEFGNVIEKETDSDKPTDSDKSSNSPKEKVLKEVEEFSERYMAMHSALEADSATAPWNTSYLEVKESETATPRVKILSTGYSAPAYTYESEDEQIATVDKQGNIKGVKPGTVFITVSSPLNSDAVAKVKVRVKDDTDLLDDYLADVPVVNNTNDSIFPTETLIGKAITDIDNDGVSELLLRFRYSDNVETINMIKIENEKCVCYKTYNNLSDLYEFNEGNGSYSNSILIHYTTGKVCMEYKGVVAKEGSRSKSSEEKILTIESGGSLSELVNFKTTTDISTKTVTSEVNPDRVTSRNDDDEDDERTTRSETVSADVDSENEGDTSSTASYVDEDEDGYDDITGEYFGSYATLTGEDITENGIDLTVKTPVKKLPQITGAPDDEDDEYYDENEDNHDDTTSEEEDDSSNTTSTVTTEIAEETTKYFVNGTPVDQSVYEEVLTRYSATYSVWNAWESVS